MRKSALGRLNHLPRLDKDIAIRTSPGMRVIRRSGSRRAGERRYFLSFREIEVLEWVGRGKPAREIGEILGITKRTIDAHVVSAVRKIGAVNRTNAVAIAARDHVISVWQRCMLLQITMSQIAISQCR